MSSKTNALVLAAVTLSAGSLIALFARAPRAAIALEASAPPSAPQVAVSTATHARLVAIDPHAEVATAPDASQRTALELDDASWSRPGSGKVSPWHTAPPRIRTPRKVFEQRYAGKSLAALRIAEAKIRKEAAESRQRALGERLARGLFTPWPASAGAPSRSEADPFFHVAPDPAAARYQIAWLPPAEYKRVYESEDEALWLAAKLAALQSAK
jgi:hypothetical protein